MLNQQATSPSSILAPTNEFSKRGCFGCVGIAASLGGVTALKHVVAGLPLDFPYPILIVQHVRRSVPSLLPRILAGCTGLRVKSAENGEQPVARCIYVAPPDHHLLVHTDGTLRLADSVPVHFCRPAADVLFHSLAEVFGEYAIATVLTGKGRDGARGVEAIRRQGGMTIAQDEATAEAPDMPCAAVDIGKADLILPLHQIAFALEVLTRHDEEWRPGGI